MDDVIRFHCPACGNALKARPAHAGAPARCPCGHSLTVPEPLPPEEPRRDERRRPPAPRPWPRWAVPAAGAGLLALVAIIVWLALSGKNGGSGGGAAPAEKAGGRPAVAAARFLTDLGREAAAEEDWPRAVSYYDEALRLDAEYGPAYAARGFAKERLGQRAAADADFAEARRREPPRPPDLKVGDRPLCTVRIPVQAGDGRAGVIEPGAEAAVVGADGGFADIELPDYGLGTRCARSELAAPAPGAAPEEAVGPDAFLRRLGESLEAHEYVLLTIDAADSVACRLRHYGAAVAPRADGPARDASTTIARSGHFGRLRDLVAAHGDTLYGLERGAPGARSLRLLFRTAPDLYLPVGGGNHALVSARARAHFGDWTASDYPADRHVLIVGEPHDSAGAQFDLYRNLGALFADNPHLLKGGRTAFLAEGFPDGEALDVGPLAGAAPDPDDALVRDTLGTFLIPAYAAYEWKKRAGIPILGHEDPELYRIGASITARAEGDPRVHRLWTQAVFARNRAIAGALVREAGKRDFPILFVGGLHLHAMAAEHVLADADWGGLADLVPPADLDRLRQAEKRGIEDYLRERKIGFLFLNMNMVAAGDDDGAADHARYNRLFEAQNQGRTDDYVREVAAAHGGTTVRPDPAAAAKFARARKAAGKGSALADRLRRLLDDLANLPPGPDGEVPSGEVTDGYGKKHKVRHYAEKKPVFRGTKETPEQVFKDGLGAKGGNRDFVRHVTDPTADDGFLGSSMNRLVAQDFATSNGQRDGYVYIIDRHYARRRGIDVVQTLGQMQNFNNRHEEEVSLFGPVPPEYIIGGYKVPKSRKAKVDFQWNPNYRRAGKVKNPFEGT